MKKHLLFISFLTVSYLSNAQLYTLGVKGGLNQNKIGSLYQRPYNGDPGINHQPNKDISLQFGAFLNVKFGKFFIQPELNYVKLKNHYDLPLKTSYWNTSKTEIPVILGFEIFDPLSLYIGPNFNFYKKTSLDGVQVTSFSDGGPDLDKNTLSLSFGIKANFGRFGLDLRYESGQKETQEELLDIIYSEYGTNLADLKSYTPSIVSLSLHINLISTDGEHTDTLFSKLFKGNACWCSKH
ncbi:hypothetical protein [Thalassobellus suaedae]|uniref:Outer membrane protein beta-barrel domain-containing protein n=1 Tax=Thalassobellus suaedae TaxID=3074124 RepID=A0ABY9Y0Z2_9FLAO|nr:hypothetical protein RHP49_11765 [Flavobacteriaceae bacterium HL-DH10]